MKWKPHITQDALFWRAALCRDAEDRAQVRQATLLQFPRMKIVYGSREAIFGECRLWWHGELTLFPERC